MGLWSRLDERCNDARFLEPLEARDMEIRDLKAAVGQRPQEPPEGSHSYAEPPVEQGS